MLKFLKGELNFSWELLPIVQLPGPPERHSFLLKTIGNFVLLNKLAVLSDSKFSLYQHPWFFPSLLNYYVKKNPVRNLNAFIIWLSSYRHRILNLFLSIAPIFDIYHCRVYLSEATSLLTFLLEQIFTVQPLLYLCLILPILPTTASRYYFQKSFNFTLRNKNLVSSVKPCHQCKPWESIQVWLKSLYKP